MVNALGQIGNLTAPFNHQRIGQIAAGDFTNVFNDRGQRRQQNAANAVPDQRQHNDQGQREGRHLPFCKVIITHAFVIGFAIQ